MADERRLISDGKWTPPAERKAALAEQAKAVEEKPLTLSEYAERVITRRQRRARRPISPTTADLYRKDWRLRVAGSLGQQPLAGLTRARVGEWWDSLPPATPTQNGRAYDLLKSVCAEAVEDGLLAEQPCRVRGAGKPSPKRQGTALTAAEVLAYLDAVPPSRRLALMAAAWCGLRSGEVRGLRRCDVDLDAGRLRVEQGVTRVRTGPHSFGWRIGPLKTKAARRSVAMPLVIVDAMRVYLRDLPVRGRDALLFPATDGVSPLNSSVLDAAHRKGRESIGREELTIHDLRRTAATLAAQGGATVRELMRLLGHTTVTVAMVYQTAEDARDAERAARLDEVILAAG